MQSERELATVIKLTVADANRSGLDYVGETGSAVSAVMRVRPDIYPPDALAAFDRYRENEESLK